MIKTIFFRDKTLCDLSTKVNDFLIKKDIERDQIIKIDFNTIIDDTFNLSIDKLVINTVMIVYEDYV